MRQKLKIEFVSDVACPWCAIALIGLERALDELADEVEADVEFQPFELNPKMPPGGKTRVEHITQKYGISAEEARSNRTRINARATEAGFDMRLADNSRIYNTFDAHRLLGWAKVMGKQLELKRALLALNFTENADVGNFATLVVAASRAGLDPVDALAVLESDAYSQQIRAEEDLWRSRGISSVPAIVVNGHYLISGGQPAAEFKRHLRKVLAEA